MAYLDKGDRFGRISIVNHWTLAALIIGMLAFGIYIEDLPKSPEKGDLVQIHKSIGVLILIFGAWRVLWRICSGWPEEIASLKPWERISARLAHYALLLAVVVMPVSGYVKSSAAGHPVSFFEIFTLPALPKDEFWAKQAGGLHEIAAYVTIAILVLHILAAVKHHVVDLDNTLRRMLGRVS